MSAIMAKKQTPQQKSTQNLKKKIQKNENKIEIPNLN
jgi:hypothetical protein